MFPCRVITICRNVVEIPNIHIRVPQICTYGVVGSWYVGENRLVKKSIARSELDWDATIL